jgi:hypothetical protein
MRVWLRSERGRSWLWALGCYAGLLLVYALVAGRSRLTDHTTFNHFALLADAWLHGRLDLGGPPPDYAGGNDFAEYAGKWFVPFPALPAALLVPMVYFAGGAERVRDGQFFLWLAPVGPIVLFLALEKLRQLGRSNRSRWQNLALSLGFALGSVYFFTAVQGSVWFAAHVVAVAFAAGYLLVSIGGARPLWAGLLLGLAYWARAPLLFGAPFFLCEAWLACRRDNPPVAAESPQASSWSRLLAALRATDWRRFIPRCALFALPLAASFGLSLLHNWARFGDPFDVGYRHLQIAWQGRIEKWGLFDYHYLAKNLCVVLTSLPWVDPFRINMHGLALWVTTPVFLYLLWPRQARPGFVGLLLTAASIGLPALFYQNTGWMQFGYRFSNDYSVFLFAALALSRPRLGPGFWVLSAWALAVNTFGAVTFDRAQYAHLYYQQASQETLYQP